MVNFVSRRDIGGAFKSGSWFLGVCLLVSVGIVMGCWYWVVGNALFGDESTGLRRAAEVAFRAAVLVTCIALAQQDDSMAQVGGFGVLVLAGFGFFRSGEDEPESGPRPG
ncbi:hypothetical protein ACQP2Y_04335 [Actinoplanes sp. CA-051413]|uniref:hypothetical protein n=1 Tax=Actinoplanes sp. CA-051413 TaxID=3239899 RepID=UPI003D994CA6